MDRPRIRVFIAGPMSSSGEPGPNVHAAATAAAELLLAGHFPFVPHVTWFLHMVRPDVDVALWHEWNLAWLRACDVLLRLPGVSRGADDEVETAHLLRIPVYTSLESLLLALATPETENHTCQWKEVADSQQDGWPAGDTVMMVCQICGKTVREELPQ